MNQSFLVTSSLKITHQFHKIHNFQQSIARNLAEGKLSSNHRGDNGSMESSPIAARAGAAHAQHKDDNNGDNDRISAAGKRALSYRVAKQLQKKHVNTCLQGLVKTVIFRKCKFITSKVYYNKVMAVVIKSEKPADPPKFVRLYKTCVLGSLNTKRSSCQQAASNCVKALFKA